MSVLFGYLSIGSFHFVRHANATDGTVISLEVKAPAGSQRDSNPNRPYLLLAPKVRYVVDGKTYTYVAAHGRYHQRLRVGDQVSVLYDPGNPQRARLSGEGRVLVPLFTLAFAAAALAVAAVLILTRNGFPRGRRPHGADSTVSADGSQVEHGSLGATPHEG
ncbi:MAG: DUF3592 domain-containing protein [Propionibacteriaceae bacterium]|nr:DUF3592 domain-containing protein [Propionibacteriaceae bacterium]